MPLLTFHFNRHKLKISFQHIELLLYEGEAGLVQLVRVVETNGIPTYATSVLNNHKLRLFKHGSNKRLFDLINGIPNSLDRTDPYAYQRRPFCWTTRIPCHKGGAFPVTGESK